MKFIIKNKIEDYEIDVRNITQICGHNIRKKDFIKNSIEKYFSSSKYSDYERNMIENISINGEKVGRQYFSVHSFSTRIDLINEIKITKTSLLLKYLQLKCQEFDFQQDILEIDNIIDSIVNNMNSILNERIGKLELDYEIVDVFKMLSDCSIDLLNGNSIYEVSNLELIEMVINLIKELNVYDPKQRLLIFNNIDHLLDEKEYEKVLKKVKNESKKMDIYALFFISIEGYGVVEGDYLEGINVINDEIFSVPSIERLENFIKKHYPIYIENEKMDEIKRYIKLCIHKFGKKDCFCSVKSDVILKMVNESLGMNVKPAKINQIEINYLNN